MKKIMLVFIIALLFVGCATVPKVEIDSKTTFAIQIQTGDKTIDATCTIGYLKDAEGNSVLDSFCTAFVEDSTGTYRCEIAVGSDGQPVTKLIDIKDNCKIEIKK